MNMPLVLLNRRRRGGAAAFTPAGLFALAEPGVWYDPSDLTTLFQDTAGTTPVTTPGQTVARVNDKSGRGNNATQATLASRPTYGIVPLGGRRNLLTRTEEFSNATWVPTTISVATDGTLGGAAAFRLTDASTTIFSNVLQTITVPADTQNYTLTCRVKKDTDQTRFPEIGIRFGLSSNRCFLSINTQTGATATRDTLGTFSTAISDAGDYWICRVTVANAGQTNCNVVIQPAIGTTLGGASATTVGSATFAAPQLELSSTATAYQRVGSAFDVTEAGVASLSYLSFDGVDDFLITPAITPGIDRAQVFAGVRKLNNVDGIIAETSVVSGTNSGTLMLRYAVTNDNGYYWRSAGSTISDASVTTGYAAPVTNVLTGLGDISGDRATLRINGIQAAQSIADQGTGNFQPHPFYIGRRGGTTLPANMQLFSFITRFGTNLDAGTITSTETWVNGKTGAYA